MKNETDLQRIKHASNQLDAQLQQVMLLGNDHASLHEDAYLAIEQLGIVDHGNQTDVILDAFAALYFIKKAGTKLRETDTPPYQVLPQELDKEELSTDAANILRRIVQGKQHEETLSEFFYLMRRAGRIFPAMILPQILNLAIKSPQRMLLMPLTGTRGQWLAAQRTAWLPLLQTPDPHRWNDANTEERLAILTYLRATRPEIVTELLGDDWNKGSVAVRRKSLEIMLQNIAPEDEAFLDWCSDDKDEKVRLAAVYALSMLPDSALMHRMLTRAETWLTNEPKELSPQDTRDGFNPDNIQLHLVTCLAPSFWQERQIPNDEAIRIGAAFAAIRHQNMPWLATLICKHLSNNPALLEAITLLKPDSFHQYMNCVLEKAPLHPDILKYLADESHFWSTTQTEKIFEWIKQLFQPKHKNSSLLSQLINHFMLKTPPRLAQAFVDYAVSQRWIYQIDDRTRSLLAFRKGLHEVKF